MWNERERERERERAEKREKFDATDYCFSIWFD